MSGISTKFVKEIIKKYWSGRMTKKYVESFKAELEAKAEDMVKRDIEILNEVNRTSTTGELKRLDIARALSIHPEFIIADEPLALLDMSIQSQIVNLLLEVQQEENTALLFISHDLKMVRMLSHTVAVMYRGKIVEYAPKSLITENPLHPYTVYLWNPKSSDFYVRG